MTLGQGHVGLCSHFEVKVVSRSKVNILIFHVLRPIGGALTLGDPRSRSHGVKVTFLGQGHPKVKVQYLGFACLQSIRSGRVSC